MSNSEDTSKNNIFDDTFLNHIINDSGALREYAFSGDGRQTMQDEALDIIKKLLEKTSSEEKRQIAQEIRMDNNFTEQEVKDFYKLMDDLE